MTTLSRHKIVISPIGDIDTSLIIQITAGFEKIFGCHIETVPLLKDLTFAYNQVRDQYLSTAILDRLSGMAPMASIKVLAICKEDLYIPILTHVYGEAQLNGKACIVSIRRLSEGNRSAINPNSYYERVVKEAIHEMGHTFGLRHCPDSECIMHYCRTLQNVDQKSDQFCRYCTILLNDEIEKLAKEDRPND